MIANRLSAVQNFKVRSFEIGNDNLRFVCSNVFKGRQK